MSRADSRCYHCGEPAPPGTDFVLEVNGQSWPMCCAGCLAVAGLIHDAGLDRYYRFRQSLARRAGDDLERARAGWMSIDAKPELWGDEGQEGTRAILLQTEGIHCAACAWLIRSRLTRLRGVRDVQVDIGSGYTRIHWRPDQTRLSEIALGLYELGYKPHLPLSGEQERVRQEERRRSLRRLGIAGLGMMQVMMYAVGLYAGEAFGMPVGAERFLEWVSLLVTTPVLLYSGRVFFEGAWRGLRAGRPGMDLPVALAIAIAYGASCYGFFSGNGHVWFDSVVMFIFFLLLGRHVEMSLRHRNQQSGSVLARLLPEWVQRVGPDGTRTALASDLQPGDRVRVAAGEAFPADGRLLLGATDVNEALLTGESFPRPRQIGDPVVAGSINLTDSVDMEVAAAGAQTTVSALGRLIESSRARRCGPETLSERIASRFVVAVLAVAAAACLWWLLHDPGQALKVTLAVLVVSCPCALSLAAPSAVAAASRGLLRRGIILTRSDALEVLASIDRVLFDKTGTLTSAQIGLERVHVNPQRPELSPASALQIAASLESASSHPLAQAFRGLAPVLPMEAFSVSGGRGVCGRIGGVEYRLGAQDFIAADTGIRARGALWLADARGWMARFEMAERLRTGAAATVRYFAAAGIDPGLLSGDAADNVEPVARRLGIRHWHAGLAPAEKLAHLEALRERGHRVLMVGDGVNDAPVLAAADVAIAVQGGTELANSTADYILTGRSLDLVRGAHVAALATRRIVKQNLAWAVAYNAAMIPLAASGLLQPWMAAIGMSASSLLVVLNAARLGREVPASEQSAGAPVAGELA